MTEGRTRHGSLFLATALLSIAAVACSGGETIAADETRQVSPNITITGWSSGGLKRPEVVIGNDGAWIVNSVATNHVPLNGSIVIHDAGTTYDMETRSCRTEIVQTDVAETHLVDCTVDIDANSAPAPDPLIGVHTGVFEVPLTDQEAWTLLDLGGNHSIRGMKVSTEPLLYLGLAESIAGQGSWETRRQMQEQYGPGTNELPLHVVTNQGIAHFTITTSDVIQAPTLETTLGTSTLTLALRPDFTIMSNRDHSQTALRIEWSIETESEPSVAPWIVDFSY